jgi:hypothetical protein
LHALECLPPQLSEIRPVLTGLIGTAGRESMGHAAGGA